MAKNKLQTASKQPAPDEFKGQQQLARIVSEERQSRHWAPARSRVTVNEWEQRRIGITYRGQRLAFHQIFRRPEKPAARVEPPAKRKQHPQPAAHHPWRFSYKAPPLSSTLAKRARGNSMQTEQQLGWNTLLEQGRGSIAAPAPHPSLAHSAVFSTSAKRDTSIVVK